MHTLDDLDKRLIATLREDGRAPVSKLAGILGVTRATVQNRLDRLTDSGAVLGFTIRAREETGPDVVRAFMMIEVSGQSTTRVIRSLRGVPQIASLHTTNGRWDLVADISCDSLASFDETLSVIRGIDGIRDSETSILLSSATI